MRFVPRRSISTPAAAVVATAPPSPTTATPTHTYTHAYDGVVGVKVTNENTLVSVAYASVARVWG